MLSNSDTSADSLSSTGPIGPHDEGAIAPTLRPSAPPRPADFTLEDVLAAHRGGKLSVELRAPLVGRRDLSMLYTPGVAGVSTVV